MKVVIEVSKGLVYPCLANPTSGNVDLKDNMSLEFPGNLSKHLYRLDQETGQLDILFDNLSLFQKKEYCSGSSRVFARKRKAWAFFKAAVAAGEIEIHNFGAMSREEAQRQEEAGHMVSRAMDQAVFDCKGGERYRQGCCCLPLSHSPQVSLLQARRLLHLEAGWQVRGMWSRD